MRAFFLRVKIRVCVRVKFEVSFRVETCVWVRRGPELKITDRNLVSTIKNCCAFGKIFLSAHLCK